MCRWIGDVPLEADPMLIFAIVGSMLLVGAVVLAAVAIRRKRADARLGYLAQYDQLTGLINRTLFHDRLNGALTRARRDGGLVTVMFLDIDGFKGINDRFGHAVGDELLRQVAARLVSVLRESDSVARIGGDEFTVVLEGGKRVEDAGQVASKILRAIGTPFLVGDRELAVTTSIGIAVYPVDGNTAEDLVKGADTAMYQAKAAGRNTYQYFTRALRDRTADRLELLDELRAALESGDQLRVEYQPKVDARRGVVIGLEAFIRWDHPERGLLMPGTFIPLAEESDLIVPMSEWLLDEACLDMRRWLDEGMRPMRVAVNASERLFRDSNLVESIAVALAAADLDPRHLEIEVTERMITQEAERASRAIERLADMGVRVSIDDFGTGYSSLRHLQSLPVRALKIDDSFVRDVDRRDEARSIACAIIAIAKSFSLEVIAEGVETAEELEALRDIGCDRVQGYLVARPLRPQDVLEFVDDYDRTLSFRPD
ncbi:MAG: EAL domain-containing protein [Acidimicrobiia bacterium]|nr:EAL domain-containing protein [Acidimicrobiia bacterium]